MDIVQTPFKGKIFFDRRIRTTHSALLGQRSKS